MNGRIHVVVGKREIVYNCLMCGYTKEIQKRRISVEALRTEEFTKTHS